MVSELDGNLRRTKVKADARPQVVLGRGSDVDVACNFAAHLRIVEGSGRRDTVRGNVRAKCNPILWHVPPLTRLFILGTPPGDMYSLTASQSQ
jgi:hypothetical protein